MKNNNNHKIIIFKLYMENNKLFYYNYITSIKD